MEFSLSLFPLRPCYIKMKTISVGTIAAYTILLYEARIQHLTGIDDSISIVSANYRDLTEKRKRKEVMNLYKKKQFSVLCLFIFLKTMKTMRNELGLECIVAPCKSKI